MTEQEWLGCLEPDDMLKGLPRRTSERKLRLFNCACWALRAQRFMKSGGRQLLAAIAKAEDLADGLIERVGRRHGCYAVCQGATANAVASSISILVERPRLGVSVLVIVDLLHCIFGNPFRRVSVDRQWLAVNDGTVPKLAQAIYEEKAFDRLPILADALEDAGCSDDAILSHCRKSGPHARGCWVIDKLRSVD